MLTFCASRNSGSSVVESGYEMFQTAKKSSAVGVKASYPSTCNFPLVSWVWSRCIAPGHAVVSMPRSDGMGTAVLLTVNSMNGCVCMARLAWLSKHCSERGVGSVSSSSLPSLVVRVRMSGSDVVFAPTSVATICRLAQGVPSVKFDDRSTRHAPPSSMSVDSSTAIVSDTVPDVAVTLTRTRSG